MEDPRYTSQIPQTLDPTLTSLNAFSYPPQAGLEEDSGFNNYPQPDVYSQSYLHNLPAFNPEDNMLDLPRSSHDDLNQFFVNTPLAGGTPGAPSMRTLDNTPLAAGTPRAPSMRALDNGGAWMSFMPRTSDWEKHDSSQNPPPMPGQGLPNAGLALDTSLEAKDDDEVEQRETIVQNGQVTPGESPSSPKSAKGGARKSTRKPRATAKAQDASTTTEQPTDEPAAPPKRVRKPRQSKKRPPTPEQEALKRETFLKRNREAAYKCRVKKKTQTMGVVERSKELDADNALKGLEVERLRREVESLRAMLLPHWRACGDEHVDAYIDNLVNEGWGLGQMVMNLGQPRVMFEPEAEPREDDGFNDIMDRTHPRDEDDDDDNVDPDLDAPAHKRRRSEAVFEMDLQNFDDAMASQAADRQRRESFFGNSIGPAEALRDARAGEVASMSSSGSATPAGLRPLGAGLGFDVLSEEFLVGDTPPPMDLSAPDGL